MSSIKSTECKILFYMRKMLISMVYSVHWRCSFIRIQFSDAYRFVLLLLNFFYHNSALTTKSENQPKTSDCCKKRDWEKSIKQNTISWHKEKWTACILNVINWMRVAQTMETHITYTKHIYIIVSSHNSPCSHLTRNKHWLRHREKEPMK